MVCKKCGNEIVENDNFCTKCGTPITNNLEENNNKEKDKKSVIQKLKKVPIKIKVLVVFIIIIVIVSIIGIIYYNSNNNLNNNSNNISNTNSNITVEETNQDIQEDVSSSKYTKEEVMELLTSKKSSNEAPMIVQLGELRLNELNYVDSSSAYIYRYNCQVMNDDTINFYIVVPEPNGSFYDIWSYQASYTITDKLIECLSKNDFSGISIKDVFKINTEYKVSHASYVQSDVLSSYLSDAISSAKGILDYDPTGKRQIEKAEESKEQLINKIKSEIESENKYRGTNFQPTEEQMEHALKHFNYKIENFNTLKYGTYTAEQGWFATNPETGTYYTKPIN